MPNEESEVSIEMSQEEESHQDVIPDWTYALVAVGEEFSNLIRMEKSKRQTLALCLPCFDYAATFLGLGVIKSVLEQYAADEQRDRMINLLDQWVSYKRRSKQYVGILESTNNENEFRIRTEKHGLWILLTSQDWPSVTLAGKSFNRNRRLSHRQISKVEHRNRRIETLSRLFNCDFSDCSSVKSAIHFWIYGNKSRLVEEITNPIFEDSHSALLGILRPQGHADYGEAFNCSISSHRDSLDVEDGAIVLIEAGRNLADQIAHSRHLNRIILLARNSADYENHANQVMQESSLGVLEGPSIGTKLPVSIKPYTFSHP